MTAGPCYSPRVDQALALVADAFRCKVRKGSGVPYLGHLLQVAAWVAEYGGREDQIIAALLHDYLEDIPEATADEVRRRFGTEVVGLVEAMSDSTTHPKPPWEERKRSFLARLGRQPAEMKLVCVSDKLHNATSLLRDLRLEGPSIWARFNASRQQNLWYYSEVVSALADGWTHPLLDELRKVVQSLRQEAGE